MSRLLGLASQEFNNISCEQLADAEKLVEDLSGAILLANYNKLSSQAELNLKRSGRTTEAL